MKRLLKKIASTVCFLAVIPFYILYRLESLIIRREQPFCDMSQFFSLIPGLTGEYIRREFYKLSLQKCSHDCCISFGTIFSHPTAEIGTRVYIGAYCTLGTVSLGDDVLLGSNVNIVSGKSQHNFYDHELSINEQGGTLDRIFVGDDTWIGNGATIVANVGRKCVIGAGSVVSEDIEEYSIAVGNPARVIKKRKR